MNARVTKADLFSHTERLERKVKRLEASHTELLAALEGLREAVGKLPADLNHPAFGNIVVNMCHARAAIRRAEEGQG